MAPTLVLAQLDRILASATFSHAERSRRLLNFLVQQVLQGEGDKLSEYSLAVEVLNRKPSFDPEVDAIVRVEAGRLRRRLAAFYEVEGRDDPVIVELPPRTYVPVFRLRYPQAGAAEAQHPVAGSRRGWRVAALVAGLLFAATAIYWMSVRAGFSRAHAAPKSQPLSIAVLPFSNLSADKDQEYFCDGLSEEVLETLTKVQGLRVVARTSALQFKGRTDDIRKIAAQLNVRLVLEGTVRKERTGLRVAVRLINAADGYDLWSQTFDREVHGVFAIQREIAQGIVGALRSQLASEHWLRPLEVYTPSLETYNLFLRGLHFEGKWNSEGLGKAIEYFREAAASDPKYAAAWAELAECYSLVGIHSGLPASGPLGQARVAAQQALDLDSTLPNAHAAMGLVKAIQQWDWDGAGRELRRARELDPADSHVREAYVMGYLLPTGKLDEALSEILEAHDLDPVSPRLHAVVGMVHYFRRQYDQAIASFREALALDPEFRSSYLGLAGAYEQKSMFREALEAVDKGKTAWQSQMATSFLGHTYALMGRRAEAQAVLQELIGLSGRKHVSPLYVATIYTGLGDKDHAFDWLERAYSEGSASLAFLKVNPRFDSLHADPRFGKLLSRIHLQ